MALQQAAFLAILVVAFGLLIAERIRMDMLGVLLILTLAVSGILKPDEALAGFASEPAIVLASVFVLSAGLYRTGLSEIMGSCISSWAGNSLPRILAVMLPIVALMSAFTHHVAVTAVILPVALTMAKRSKLPPSKLLMPAAIGSSLGTTITVLAAPSLLIASQLLRQAGQPGLGVFAPAPLGLALTIAGTLYMLFVGRFLLPERRGGTDQGENFRLDEYFTELRILPDSPLAGKTVSDISKRGVYDFTVVARRQGERWNRRFGRQRRLEPGDVLLVKATPEDMLAMRQEDGAKLEPLVQYGEQGNGNKPHRGEEPEAEESMVQVIVAPESRLVGRTLSQVDFRRHHDALVLGLWRQGDIKPDELAATRLQVGDVLVLQGDDEALRRISNDPDFLMMVPFQGEALRRRRALLAAAIMAATVALAASQLLSLAMATLAGAAAMVLSGCVTPNQAYRAIDQRMYLFIAGAIPLGTAMQKTGTANLVAGWLKSGIAGWQPSLILLAIFLTVGVFVQFMGSDSATVALFAPVAIAFGATMQTRPEPYVIAITMAAITATLTPMSHHNLIIYGPGGYKFFDYTKVGGPLTLLLGAIVAIMAPLIWR
ncbi:MAG TPA: SLC13 family permease [Chloroflexota bacterium]